MALSAGAKTALQAIRDGQAVAKAAAAARGDGPGAAHAERLRQQALNMAAIHWDTTLT